jgi:hypothetical protein
MDKLSIINNALRATGNNTVNVLNDPSDEYIVANGEFDRKIRFLTARHTWPFATTTELLVRAPDADNKSRRFSKNGFRLPPNTLHVKEVFRDTVNLTDYEIMGAILSCAYDSEIYAAVVIAPPDASWHPMAEEILTLYVEAGCLRGLNEDFTEATKRENSAEALLMETRTTVDQQNPARNMYKSKIAAARRSRRV